MWRYIVTIITYACFNTSPCELDNSVACGVVHFRCEKDTSIRFFRSSLELRVFKDSCDSDSAPIRLRLDYQQRITVDSFAVNNI